jgi:hypothetical protein
MNRPLVTILFLRFATALMAQEEVVVSGKVIGELNNIYDLGRITLDPSPEEIEEVTISRQQEAISADMDKKTYRMDDVLAQSGGSVLDALKGLPGITVDQEGKVMLRGSDKVAVLIDNRQSSLTGFGNQKGLDNIPVSNIESIEIINNPSVKYDASGMAGIININYRKEKETGFHGEAGLAAGAGTLTPAGEDLPNNEFTTRFYDDGRQTASQVPENRVQSHYIINGGIDWNLNEYNSLTLSSVYDYESHRDTAQVAYIDMTSATGTGPGRNWK